MSSIIKIDGLTYKTKEKIILENIKLDIEKNTWVSIIGPNASGKTTLIKILAGILPYNGYININNFILDNQNKKEIRKTIAVVLDDTENQLINQTVLEELSFGMENLNYPRAEIEEKIKQISKEFMIENLLNEKIQNITNSEKQLVNIVSNLVTNPSILVLDDALHQMEPSTKEMFLNNLKRYKKKTKLTIVMSTHNLEETLITDRVIIIDNKKIIADSTPLSILKQEKLLSSSSLEQPFIIELSQKLMLYNLINHTYLDKRKLVDDLWK